MSTMKLQNSQIKSPLSIYINDYRILKGLGSGSSGKVVLAKNDEGQKYAIQIIG